MKRKIASILVPIIVIISAFFIYNTYRENNKELTDGSRIKNVEISTGNNLDSTSIISGEVDFDWPETVYSAGYVINGDTMYLLVYKTKGILSNKKFEVNLINDQDKVKNIKKIVVSYTKLKNRNGFYDEEFPSFKNTLLWEK